jgi:Ricin-type beta-trefoil lectin domain
MGETRRSGPALYIFQHSHQHVSPAARPIDGPGRGDRPGAVHHTDPTEAQEWVYVPNGGAGFHFENALSGLCLDARGKAEDGTSVQQWTCDQISNENWEPSTGPQGQSVGPVHSRVSGSDSFCLNIPGGQQAPGLGMQILRCNGAVSQQWELRPISPFVIDLKGLNETVAQNRILLFDLQNPKNGVEKSTTNCTSQELDLVTDQDPEPGSQQPPGAVVTLTICKR